MRKHMKPVQSDSVSHLQMTTLTLCEAPGSYRFHLHKAKETLSLPRLSHVHVQGLRVWLKGIHPRSTRPCVCVCMFFLLSNRGLDGCFNAKLYSSWMPGWIMICQLRMPSKEKYVFKCANPFEEIYMSLSWHQKDYFRKQKNANLSKSCEYPTKILRQTIVKSNHVSKLKN